MANNLKGSTVSTGHYWNVCTDADKKTFETYSFWHKASDCEFNDGTTAEEKIGAIKGITTDTSKTETGYALDASALQNIFSLDGDILNITL